VEVFVSYRWISAVVVLIALLAAGCGGGKTTVTSPTSHASQSSASKSSEQPSSDESAPVATLDSSACVEVTQANLDLATASNKDDARKPADILEKYNPPASVREAIEHFVQTGGAQFDDPDFDKYNKLIDNWVKQVCPL
jgi:hypothetical protein